MIIINYKAYNKAIGKNAEKITEKIEEAAKNTNHKIIVTPQTADLNRVKNKETTKYAQHIDPVETGSQTGSNQIKAVKQSEVEGTLINHSEKRLKEQEIKQIIQKCREDDLRSIVCAQTPEECGKYSDYNPDYIAFEPPELIGGDISVSKAEPEIMEKAIEETGEVPALAGAGIKTRKDVEKAIEHGCEGILVASGVIKADDVQAEVEELCKGL